MVMVKKFFSRPLQTSRSFLMKTIPHLSALALVLLLTSAAPLLPPDPEKAMQDFLKVFWDEEENYFYQNSWRTGLGGPGPVGGLYADFWWEAQLWDLVMDAFEREGSEQYRQMIDDVYDGFVAHYSDWQNDFNDDLGWWAQGAMRAYNLTENERYLEQAKSLFEFIWGYWTDDYGGGVLWKNTGEDQKNVATNGPLTVTAVRLYQATGDEDYLEKARQLWNFVNEQLTDGGARVYDNYENGELRQWDFTYNFGNFILASLALREVSEDEAEKAMLLERSVLSADWVIENLTNSGILIDEGLGDGGGFKGVFVRALNKLRNVEELVAAKQEEYSQFLQDNATQVWNQRRESDGTTGSDWSSPVPEEAAVQVLAAASAMAVLQLAPTSDEAKIVTGNGLYEAENALRLEVSSNNSQEDYMGRGYIDHFERDESAITFRVNVAEAKTYTLQFRYSTISESSRQLLVNDAEEITLEFPQSTDWTILETNVELAAGANTITVKFDEEADNTGTVNLDNLQIVLGEAS
jgi:predicted alpha-1,6-mannanase (GH76 family)